MAKKQRPPLPHISDFNGMVLELNFKPSDRDLAIVGCSLLDLVLEQSIASKLIPLRPDQQYRLFGDANGVLHSLSDKAWMAHALGVLSIAARVECLKLGTIRNTFAHTYRDITCDDTAVSALIDELAEPTQRSEETWTACMPPGTTHQTLPMGTGTVFKYKRGKDDWVEVENIAMIVDQHGRIGFYVPTLSRATENRRERLLYSLWNCIHDTCGHAVTLWADAGIRRSTTSQDRRLNS